MTEVEDENLLMLAATQSVGTLKQLLARNVDVRALRDSMGQPFCHVAMRSPIGEARLLLSTLIEHHAGNAESIIEVTNRWDMTPFSQALVQDNAAALRLLVELGADVDQLDNLGRTPLHYVCSSWRSSAPVVTLLLALGTNFRAVHSGSTQTACHWAAQRSGNFLAILLAAGADFDQPDNQGQTPRMIAGQNSYRKPTLCDIDDARQEIAKARLDLVRSRAFEICVALQPLSLDALQL